MNSIIELLAKSITTYDKEIAIFIMCVFSSILVIYKIFNRVIQNLKISNETLLANLEHFKNEQREIRNELKERREEAKEERAQHKAIRAEIEDYKEKILLLQKQGKKQEEHIKQAMEALSAIKQETIKLKTDYSLYSQKVEELITAIAEFTHQLESNNSHRDILNEFEAKLREHNIELVRLDKFISFLCCHIADNDLLKKEYENFTIQAG